jgi:hypothetical protein
MPENKVKMSTFSKPGDGPVDEIVVLYNREGDGAEITLEIDGYMYLADKRRAVIQIGVHTEEHDYTPRWKLRNDTAEHFREWDL